MARDQSHDELDELLEERLADPDFRAAYEDARARSAVLLDLVNCRTKEGLTQEIVAERMQTTQSAVSEFEGGGTDPRLSTLQRYARAVDRHLNVSVKAFGFENPRCTYVWGGWETAKAFAVMAAVGQRIDVSTFVHSVHASDGNRKWDEWWIEEGEHGTEHEETWRLAS